MLFVSLDDFYQKAASAVRLSPDQEKSLALKMQAGDPDARQAIINSYLPLVAACIQHSPKEIQTLKTVYCCITSLEKGVDSFCFGQDSEPFLHHLNWRLRQCIAGCIADR